MTTRRKIPLRLRRKVTARAQGYCEYCRAPQSYSLDTYTIDHIQPVADFGSDELDNLALACHNCNNRKQDDRAVIDAETGEIVPLYNPRADAWSDHFVWSADTLNILPVTAIGRVTITRLQLNRQGAINIRRALIALGETHPPPITKAEG